MFTSEVQGDSIEGALTDVWTLTTSMLGRLVRKALCTKEDSRIRKSSDVSRRLTEADVVGSGAAFEHVARACNVGHTDSCRESSSC